MAKKEDAASRAVLQYFQQQNRPYSAQDVFMNLHKEHGKPLVQRVLDLLVAENKIKEKVNGKQKCYVANQDTLPAASEEELARLDADCAKLAETLTSNQDNLKALESKVRKLNSSLTTQEAQQKLERLEAENAEMEERLHALENQQELVTPAEKERIRRIHEQSVTAWRKRKRCCMDALDSILESWPKSKKDLFEQIGLETDEDAGVSLPKL